MHVPSRTGPLNKSHDCVSHVSSAMHDVSWARLSPKWCKRLLSLRYVLVISAPPAQRLAM